jgi:hypothetical protein
MKTETIVMCVVALILGMLLANMLKSVCGCQVVEGVELFTPQKMKRTLFDPSQKPPPAPGKLIWGKATEHRVDPPKSIWGKPTEWRVDPPVV